MKMFDLMAVQHCIWYLSM